MDAPSSSVPTGSSLVSAFSRTTGGQSSRGASYPRSSYGSPPASGGGSVFDNVFAGIFGDASWAGVPDAFAKGMKSGSTSYASGLRYTYDVPGLDQARRSMAYTAQAAARSASAFDDAVSGAQRVMREPYRPLNLDSRLFTIPRPAALPAPFGSPSAVRGAGRTVLVVGAIAALAIGALKFAKSRNKAKQGAGR